MMSHSVEHDNEKGWPLQSIASLSRENSLEQTKRDVKLVVPPEGGLQAWLFIAGAFVIEAVCWGFPIAFGVFASHYQERPEFANQDIINSIGTMATGFSAVLNPFLTYFGAKYPAQRGNTMRVGAILCVLSALGAAFSRTAALLVLTQGIGWGLGSALAITPTLSLLVEWFEVRKGFAYGVMFGGSGLTGAVLPFIFSALLSRYGQTPVLLGWAGVTLVTLLPATILIRGNFPIEQIAPVTKIQWKLAATPLFALLGTVVFLQGAVNYLPPSFLPVFGLDAGLVDWEQAFLLSALNVATIPGQAIFGWLADVYGSYFPLLLGSVLSAASVLLIWGFARTFAILMIFGIVYGVVSGGVTVLRARFATTLTQGVEDPSQELIMFGIMRCIGGFGGIGGGLVGSSLIPDVGKAFGNGYAGGSWTVLVVFVGLLFLVTGLGYLGKFIKRSEVVEMLGEKRRSLPDSRRSWPLTRRQTVLPELDFGRRWYIAEYCRDSWLADVKK